MEDKTKTICGTILLLTGLFFPFLGLELNRCDITPWICGIIATLTGLGLITASISDALLKKYLEYLSSAFTVLVIAGFVFIAYAFLRNSCN